MACVDIRSFTSFSPKPSRLNISVCVLTTRDYPWRKITSTASASPEIVSLSRERWQRLMLGIKLQRYILPPNPCFILLWPNSTVDFSSTNDTGQSVLSKRWPVLMVAANYCGACNSEMVSAIKRKGTVESLVSSDSGYLSQAPCLPK